MTDSLFSAVELATAGRAGYRLQHVEVFNWGTFDSRVWRLSPHGETSLLTGDIGSGKSTLVDAITTLLLPANKIAYNKAAGADSRERTLRSYVEGHYKSERIEATGASRPIGLRDQNAYSVVLGVFVNDGYDETVTLAQVFHQKDRTGQPDRFFVTATSELSVETDFAGFGADLNSLRRRLRVGGAEITNGFPDYGRTVRRLLGIRSEQAMELFHQTVSMKSVGNLNEFVRNHMLEPADAAAKVKGIVGHFEDLTKAHDAVKRAREQLEALRPLVATTVKYDDALVRRADFEAQRQAVRLFFAELRIRLLGETIASNTDLRAHRAAEADEAGAGRHRLAADREQLITERTGAGGDRVSQLEQLASSLRAEAQVRRGRRDRFSARLADAGLVDAGLVDGGLAESGLSEVTDAGSFSALLTATPIARQAATDEQAALDGQVGELTVSQGELKRTSEETNTELFSLAGRTSNLPSSQLEIRGQLCADLGIDESELPFAGELIDVGDDHSAWRGAAERVLRGFALSLIVPQHHYDGVARWVNERRLTHRRTDGRVVGSRLVYERMPARRVRVKSPTASGVLLLADTLEVRDGPFRDYLEGELVRRADYRCVADLAQFRDERRAVTKQGQVRSGDRHEKDDRSRVDDPKAWVLGWVNERKVAALTEQRSEQQRLLVDLDEQLKRARARRTAAQSRVTALASLAEYTSWAELDWASALSEAEQHHAERSRLLSGSSTLTEIERRLEANAERLPPSTTD
ncbi:ATP-binding protein [Humibacillus sp. DSM 29435]|uniref:ATP-binding protein n=1 Tax=Humibacillus sp. DSM 29435 TaxID=1869167 RepID=UPI001C2F844E|nr:ATP-binding protein [Humibacillus sp. DSM 29435]